MKITPSQLLQSTNKYITSYNCSMVAVEGPNMPGKLGMGDLSIPYETFFVSKMYLEANEEDKPIMYGFLGTDVTFLMIKVIYPSVGNQTYTQTCSNSTENYIEYYFENGVTGSTRRYIADLMILTGSDTHRVPQVYLNNPNNFRVEIEVMVANTGANTISTILDSTNIFSGLYYNSIASDQIYDLVGNTGSTQFEIVDSSYNTQLVIPYSEIDVLEKDGASINIITNHDDSIELRFLSEYNAYQAISRINWVLNDTNTRYLKHPGTGATYPIIDLQSPLVTYIPHTINTLSLNGGISKNDIIDYFVYSIVDYADTGNTIIRDGIIYKENINVSISRVGSLENLTEITRDGNYEIVFSIKDLANNETSDIKYLLVDSEAPVFTLYSKSNTMYLSQGDTTITGTELQTYYIQSVFDAVDGPIAFNDVYFSGLSFSSYTGAISQVGSYPFKFYASDTVGNVGYSTTIPLLVYELSAATINFYTQYSGSTITGTTFTGFTESQLITEMVSGVTDEFELTLTIADVYTSGATYPLQSGNTYVVNFNVANFSQLTGTTTKTIVM